MGKYDQKWEYFSKFRQIWVNILNVGKKSKLWVKNGQNWVKMDKLEQKLVNFQQL